MRVKAKRIAVTGGAGQIAYQLLFRIAAGDLLGSEQPFELQILEIPSALAALEAVKMELEDCTFPLLQKIEVTADPYLAFREVDFALLIGAKPRGPGMERKDLLSENGKIFVEQGKALNEVAKADVKVFVVGNPCNTNCLIAMHQAPRLAKKNFYAMTRLDQNRATFFLADKANVPITGVSNVTIWGNHSSTQVPDFLHAKILSNPVKSVIQDQHWLENEFVELVQKRGAAIIQKRGKSSAASAAHALIETIKETLAPTQSGNWHSLSIISEGNPYGIDQNLIFSFPCFTDVNHEITIVPALELDDFLLKRIKTTEKELIEERNMCGLKI